MAAARYARRKQCGQCAQGRATLGFVFFALFWGGVWLWFGARTLRAARRLLLCQQLGSSCLHAARLWKNLERLQRR